MHELGVIIEVVNTVREFCEEQGIGKIDSLVLQIGEISSVLPRFIEECYPAAVDGTFMEDAKLVIETIPANAHCKDCNKVYRITENPNPNKNVCPNCGGADTSLLSGREFNIKEIVVPDEE